MYIKVWITGLNVDGQLETGIFISFLGQFSQFFCLS